MKTYDLPDENGCFGTFGGRFVAESLMPLILELEETYKTAKKDPIFNSVIKSNIFFRVSLLDSWGITH